MTGAPFERGLRAIASVAPLNAALPRLSRSLFAAELSAELSNSNVKAVALTRTPENVDENYDISFEAAPTPSEAGHIDMLFFQFFCL